MPQPDIDPFANFDLTEPVRGFGEPEPHVGPRYWTGERIAGWIAGAGSVAVFITACVCLIAAMIHRAF